MRLASNYFPSSAADQNRQRGVFFSGLFFQICKTHSLLPIFAVMLSLAVTCCKSKHGFAGPQQAKSRIAKVEAGGVLRESLGDAMQMQG